MQNGRSRLAAWFVAGVATGIGLMVTPYFARADGRGVDAARLQRLEDRQAIEELFTAYGATLDSHDFAAFGRLFAKTEDADRKIVDRVAQVAAARGIPRAQVALAWLLAKPVITAPIVGATKLRHLDDALASIDVKLSDDEIALLEESYVPHAVVGFD